MTSTLALALVAGMLATVNPCGFALLPAYLSMFVGMDDRGRASGIGRAVAVAGVMTLGFVTVFGLFGIVARPLLATLREVLPFATIGIGLLLIPLGLYLLAGRDLVLSLPKLSIGGRDGSLVSMYLFGVSYAVASLSCTIPPFVAVTAATISTQSYGQTVLTFVTYGVGMGVVVAVLTVAVALAKKGLVGGFRSFMPHVNRVAGLLMIIAGAYVAYYGWYEHRLFTDPASVGDDPIIGAASRLQGWLSSLFPSRGQAPYWAAGGAALVVGAWVLSRRKNAADNTAPVEADAGEIADSPAAADTGMHD